MDRPRRSFLIGIAFAAAAGLALRLLFVFLVAADTEPGGDGVYYHGLANVLADGRGFVEPLALLGGRTVPTAEHPPLYPLLLAFVSELGGTSEASHRAASSLLGTATVPAIGLVARRLAGDRAGLIAAGIAAVYPMLVILDGTLYAESLYVLLITVALFVALGAARHPSASQALVLGALVGLAALTRNEGVLLLGLLAVPALWRPGGAGVRHLALASVAAALVIAPWTLYSSLRFDRVVPISTNTGVTLAGANCDTTYSGDAIGQWAFSCAAGAPPHGPERSEFLTRRGLRYAGDHLDRLPLVAAVRVLRTWELFRPWNQGAFYGLLVDGRDMDMQRAGLVVLWLLLPFAAAGAFVLRRRRRELLVVAAPAVMVTLAAALSSGSSRLRAAAEVTLVVLAAVAVDAWLRRRGSRSPEDEPAEVEGRAAVT